MKTTSVAVPDPYAQSQGANDNLLNWIDLNLVQEALVRESRTVHERPREVAEVENVTFSRAINPGESYCSAIYRVTASLKAGTQRTILIKVLPEDDTMAKAVFKGKHFVRETAMMDHIIPAMQELLVHASPNDFAPFAARCLHHGTSPTPFLMVEDLKPHGFRLAERRRGLGLRHCLLALRTLARFHAASVALLAKDPSIAEALSNPMKIRGAPFERFTATTQRLAAGACKQWTGFQEYGAALDTFWPIALDKFAELSDARPGGFKVIVHGDYWLNNIMFQYDNQNLTEIRMVDFQISHVASPAIDLLYFLSTSPSDEVSEQYEDLLIREYHVTLAETLGLLGQRTLSLHELRSDIDTHGLYALFGCLGVLPLVRADFSADLSSSSYECPAVRRWIQRMLPEYKRRGWLSVPLLGRMNELYFQPPHDRT